MKPRRYIFVRKPLPWYWIFTPWRSCWRNYGELEHIPSNDPRYKDAPYELGYLWFDPPNRPQYEALILNGANADLRSMKEK